MHIELPPYIEYAIDTLRQNGFDAYAVGGCVRDSILGAIPKDWDIATGATPPEICEVFAGYKTLLHGVKYGTVAVLFGDVSVDITTFRADGAYTDNRRPDEVRFTRNLRDDLMRRDFTINALAYSHDSGIVDCFSGRTDMAQKIIRCVGIPEERFGEDALRILRALRFASVLSFCVEERTASAIHYLKHSLKNIASERVCAELSGILSGNGNSAAAVLTEFSDVIRVLIPELSGAAGDWGFIARAIAQSPQDLALRLALLLREASGGAGAGDIVCGILRRLRFKNEIIDDVTALVQNQDADICGGSVAIKRLLNRLGEKRLKLLLQMRRLIIISLTSEDQMAFRLPEDPTSSQLHEAQTAPGLSRDIDAAECMISGIIKRGECYSLNHLEINGRDLMAIGFKPGKQLGTALNILLEQVMAQDSLNERDTLTHLAESLLKTGAKQ